MATPNQVLAIAKKFVDDGYKEGPNNDTIFGNHAGAPNAPWCASFVWYCVDKAGAGTLIPKKFINCQTGLKWFATRNQLLAPDQAQPGDLVFFNFDNDATTTEHVGIVYVNPRGKELITFEGNTSKNGSQSNGDGCYKKKRPYGKIVGIGRPDWSKLL